MNPTNNDSIDFDQLVTKMSARVSKMTYWPVDNIVEALLSSVMTVVCTGSDAFDRESPIAMEIRTACFQYLANRDTEYLEDSPEHILSAQLHSIFKSYHDRKRRFISGRSKRTLGL